MKPKKGQEFLACTVAALRGSDSDVSYTKFDCRVSGADAQAIVVKRLESDVAADKSVIIGFRIADIYPEMFTFEKGDGRDSRASASGSTTAHQVRQGQRRTHRCAATGARGGTRERSVLTAGTVVSIHPRGLAPWGGVPIRHTKENSMCRPIESMSDAALLSTLVGPRTAANLLKDASGSLSRLLNADVAQQVPSSSVGRS